MLYSSIFALITIYLERDVALLNGDAKAPELGVVGEEALLEAAHVGLDLRVGET